MPRKLTLIIAALAMSVVALGPGAAATAAAGNGPATVTEPYEFRDVHTEPDGSTTEVHLVGVRTITTFSDGRVMSTDEYTDNQIARTATGGLLYQSTTTAEVRQTLDGESVRYLSNEAHTDMLWGDGRECVIDVRYLVVNDRQIIGEQIGPICQ